VRGRQRRDGQRAAAVAVGPAGGQQLQLAGQGAGELAADALLLRADRPGGGLGDGQPPPEAVGLVVVVDEDRGAVRAGGEAVQRESDDVLGAAAGVDEDLGPVCGCAVRPGTAGARRPAA